MTLSAPSKKVDKLEGIIKGFKRIKESKDAMDSVFTLNFWLPIII